MQLVKGKLESGPQRIPALAGGDVKSAGGICQDVPKLPEIGCLSLILPILPGQTNLLDTFRNLIRIVSLFLPNSYCVPVSPRFSQTARVVRAATPSQ
jgi:hypothetical protein